MIIHIANVTTESCDHYTYLYKNAPTHEEVIKRVWESEGMIEDLSWYQETTSVHFSISEVIE